jgi:hypothetical protein
MCTRQDVEAAINLAIQYPDEIVDREVGENLHAWRARAAFETLMSKGMLSDDIEMEVTSGS